MTWDEYFMANAEMIAERSTCDRAHVGAVLVKDNRIIATGYNGAPTGMSECDDVGHLMVGGHCKRTIHAELNALLQCAKFGTGVDGATLYVTHAPCLDCCHAAMQVGISRVVVARQHSFDAVGWLNERGINAYIHTTHTTANR